MKKLALTAAAAGLVLSGAALAGGYTPAEMHHNCGVSGLGVFVTSSVGNPAGGSGGQGIFDFMHDINVGLGYVMNPWEMGISFGGTHTSGSAGVSNFTTRLYAGHRWALFHCLFGSVGVNGSYNHQDNTITRYVDAYSAGAYVGLSWEPSAHFAIFTRINAFSWNRTRLATGVATQPEDTYNFFNAGVVGMSYYFGNLA